MPRCTSGPIKTIAYISKLPKLVIICESLQFDTFASTIEKYEIQMEDVSNMDETGFLISTIQNARIIVDKTVRMKY